MHFKDLDLCRYHRGPLDADEWAVPLRAVGWLAHARPFDRGGVPDGFVDRFAALVEQTRACFAQYAFRGLHDCELCAAAGAVQRSSIDGSSINVLVPGEGEVFAATAGLLHYVTAHSYRPPKRFIEATLACRPCDSPAYMQALRAANADKEPPLERWDDMLLRQRLAREAARPPLAP